MLLFYNYYNFLKVETIKIIPFQYWFLYLLLIFKWTLLISHANLLESIYWPNTTVNPKVNIPKAMAPHMLRGVISVEDFV